MIEILVKEYSGGKKKVVYKEKRDEPTDKDYMIERLHEKKMKNMGEFTLYMVFDFGVYIVYYSNGIQEIADNITFLSKSDIELLCNAIKEVDAE